jgi:uncharacterized protein (DUF58 family)
MGMTERSAWTGGRRLHLDPGGRAMGGLGAAVGAGALATGRPALLIGGLALGLLVVLDAVSAWRALPAAPVGVRAADGVTGEASDHELGVGKLGRPLLIGRSRPGGVPAVRLPADRTGDPPVTTVTAPLALPARGLHREERFTVWASGPLGLVGARREQRTIHQPALAVGPTPVAHALHWPAPTRAGAPGDRRLSRGDDLFRAVRPYRAGDHRRSLHWPATARTGSLMVRETDGTGVPTVRLAVGFATPGPAAEAALGRAAWASAEARRAGWDVILVTCEGDGAGSVERPVSGPPDLVRRLAAAVPGRVQPRPAPVPTRWITPAGDRWS